MEQQKIDTYLKSKLLAWSPKTLASEAARLYTVMHLLHLPPTELYAKLSERYKKYSLKTSFIRIAEFKNYCGDASYKQFMRDNARLFKNSYTKKIVTSSFNEAIQKISIIENKAVKQIAELMLTTGLRVHEAQKYDGSGEVVGKGLKKRPVFSSIKVEHPPSYHTIRRELAKVGLRPHDLRKLAATKLAMSGMRDVDLMEVMGWSSMETASNYLQVSSNKKLEDQVKGVLQWSTT